MRPGTTQLTVTPCGANSDASALVKPIRPDLPAATCRRPGAPRCVLTPPILMMRPYLLRTMCGSTAREQRNAPSSTTPMTSCHSFSDISSVGASLRMAALFTRMSIASEGGDRLLGHGGDGGLVGDVGKMHERARAGRLDLLRHALGLLPRGASIDDHRRAFAREGQRHGPADAPHAAGDDGDLAFESLFLESTQFLPVARGNWRLGPIQGRMPAGLS